MRLGMILGVAAVAMGCQFMQSAPSTDAAAHDSLVAHIDELDKQLADSRAQSQALTANVQRKTYENALLTRELERTRDVLEYAERQFIALEHGLRQNETRASAVATIAEAQLRYDRALQSNPALAEVPNMQDALAKRQLADDMVNDKRYAASVYFAQRATRMVDLSVAAARPLRMVAVSEANLRSGPGLDHDVVAMLTRGVLLVEIATQDDWRQVEATDGKLGWIHVSVIATR